MEMGASSHFRYKRNLIVLYLKRKETMSKKLYLEPEMEVIRLTAMQSILAGSIQEDGETPKDETPGGDDDF